MEKQGSGWLVFASIVLIVAGVMRVIDGIWALAYEGPIQGGLEDGLLGEKVENYGWLWLIVGVVLIVAGFVVANRSQWARWVGIIAAAIAAISAIVWIPYYPVWSLTYILVAFLVIYGLTMYGSREGSEV
jgi:uncharacterized membrane protein HdeD (DUF308 family)